MTAKKRIEFPSALRSFVGYLEGTEKSLLTIKNYRLDLLAFQDFLVNHLGPKPKSLDQISADDLDRYHQYLKSLGLKTNTRRRKLMTLRRFLSFMANRKKLTLDLGKTLPTPYKLERIPVTVPAAVLLKSIRSLPTETDLDFRNRVLFRTLLETGCLISESSRIRWEDWHPTSLEITGKRPRSVPVSAELYEWTQELKARKKADLPWVFQGFNKFGSLGEPISSRGIEILVKSYAGALGFPDLVPRTFRHSAVLGWFQERVTQDEIQRRLGLKSAYAFRAFASLRPSDSPRRKTILP
jgi:site-specific recombinase XerD